MNLCFKSKSRIKAQTEHCLNSINYCIACPWHGVGREELQGQPVWAEARGCPVLDTAHSRHLPRAHGTAHSWAQQPRWWCLCKNILGKRQNHQTVRGGGNGGNGKQSEKRERQHQGQTRKAGGAPWWSMYFPAACGEPMLEQSEDSWRKRVLPVGRDHAGAGEKVGKGRSGRENIPVYWPDTPIPPTPFREAEGRKVRTEKWSWTSERQEERWCVNVCLFLSTQIYSNWQQIKLLLHKLSLFCPKQ